MTEEEVLQFIQLNGVGSNVLQVGFINLEGHADCMLDKGKEHSELHLQEEMPESVELVLSNRVYVCKKVLSPNALNRLMRLN
jgi:hypothetical protein